MSSIFVMLIATGGIILAVAAFLLAILVLRNPHNPSWVHSEGVSQMTALLMTTGISAALAVAVQAYASAGVSVAVALCVTSGVVIVAGVVLYGVFGIGERLRRADAGRSTLEPIDQGSALQNNKAGAF